MKATKNVHLGLQGAFSFPNIAGQQKNFEVLNAHVISFRISVSENGKTFGRAQRGL